MPKKIDWFLINENYGANLCPYAFHFDADYHGFKKVYGRGMNYQGVGTENGFLRQAYGLTDYNFFAKFTFDKLTNDKPFTRRMLQNIYKYINQFHNFNKQVIKRDLSKLTNRQITGLFQSFYDNLYWMSTWSVPFSFTEYSTALWTESLTKYLATLKIPKQYTSLEVYNILTSSSKKAFTAKEKESTLRLSVAVSKSKSLKRVLKQPTLKALKVIKIKHKAFHGQLKKHTYNYAWLNYGFGGPLLDEKYFLSVIRDFVLDKNPRQELADFLSFIKTLSSKQKSLINNLGIDKKHQWQFWVAREYGFQKAYRKDIENCGYYAYELMLKELGRRIGITVKQGHYLLNNEIINILFGKKDVSVHKVNDRIKCCFYVVAKGKARLLTGKRAKAFIKNLKTKPVPKGLKQLTGQCACRGHVRGTVKIIRGKVDYKKFKSGDILVTWATNPNMVPLMKRSAAILTDEGGVTCHAAIVSRELNIPCVIGTKYATKVLKDGDKVEVDATKGVVKKL